MPSPTIDHDEMSDPEWVISHDLCEQNRLDAIMQGHIEENLLDDTIVIRISFFEKGNRNVQAFQKVIPVSQVNQSTNLKVIFQELMLQIPLSGNKRLGYLKKIYTMTRNEVAEKIGNDKLNQSFANYVQ